jgi:hypothetical protein
VIAKRAARSELAHERSIYKEVLPWIGERAIRYLGWAEEGEHAWLFIDDAPGAAYDPSAPTHRHAAAAWLASLHFGALAVEPTSPIRERGLDHYMASVSRVRVHLAAYSDDPRLSETDRAVVQELIRLCDVVDQHWNEFDERCAAMPRTLVHGDFSPQNVRILGEPPSLAVMVFDWEMSGRGFPGIDLARLALDERRDSLSVYRARASSLGHDLPGRYVWEAANLGLVLRIAASLDWLVIDWLACDVEWQQLLRTGDVQLHKFFGPTCEWLRGAFEVLGWGGETSIRRASLPVLDRRSLQEAGAML